MVHEMVEPLIFVLQFFTINWWNGKTSIQSHFSTVHQGLSKQVIEEANSYNQRYIPWNPPPYQHHAPQCNDTNPMNLVMHIMDMKILHHHTDILKMESKKLFSCYVKKGKSFGKPKNESTIK
ncbi:hypothetical protein PIB30_064480 [Stylosanthes scabra]|uniref:Uncharacterized protein n=1 Tax=Stylosanthes scabra TaxID=79078 RepID=A0ABU6QMG5_9FABA|nr:hypothetical protein [Stylosanthes scabra]